MSILELYKNDNLKQELSIPAIIARDIETLESFNLCVWDVIGKIDEILCNRFDKNFNNFRIILFNRDIILPCSFDELCPHVSPYTNYEIINNNTNKRILITEDMLHILDHHEIFWNN